MNRKPEKISIIIPFYNTEDYLSSCLESCVDQTLWDIEIICVNDGSLDRSADVIREFAADDSRVRLINKEHSGRSSARNTGINQANGEVLMFLDSDDFLSHRACEKIWEEWTANRFDIAAFGCDLIPSDYPKPEPGLIRALTVHDERYSGFTPEILFTNKAAKPYIGRQAYASCFLEREQLRFHEDIEIGEDLAFQMEGFPAASRFSFLSTHLYNYRWARGGSTVNESKKNLVNKMENHIRAVEHITAYWSKRGWLNFYGSQYLDWMLNFIVPGLLELDQDIAEKNFYPRLRKIIDCYSMRPLIANLNPNAKILYRAFGEEKNR